MSLQIVPCGSVSGLQGPVSPKPRKLFGLAKPFLIICILKKEIVYMRETLHEVKLCSYQNYVERTAL